MSRARDLADLAGAADAGTITGKNLIINGSMQVWQRGTDFNSIGNFAYTADRFTISRSHTVNVDRVACSLDGFKYAMKITNVASGNPTVYQKIENDGRIYGGQTYTFSFWAKASEAITMRSGRVYNFDDSVYVVDYDTVDLTTSWQKFYITHTVGSGWDENDVSYGLQILAGHTDTLSAGSTLEITGLQYELGTTATPFEHESYGETLAKCQRYYYKHASGTNFVSMSDFYSSPQGDGAVQFPVTMRASPSLDANSGTNYWGIYVQGTLKTTSSAWVIFRQSERIASIYNQGFSGITTGTAGRIIGNNSNAYMAFDAEL